MIFVTLWSTMSSTHKYFRILFHVRAWLDYPADCKGPGLNAAFIVFPLSDRHVLTTVNLSNCR